MPGADYLITICTLERRPGLTKPELQAALQAELTAMSIDEVLEARALVLMPDHLHLLISLGEKLELSRAVARLKSKISPVLRKSGLGWQTGFHDHRVRADESLEPYFRYIHLNPYQARLIETGVVWPYSWFRREDWDWFEALTDDGRALPEWLTQLP